MAIFTPSSFNAAQLSKSARIVVDERRLGYFQCDRRRVDLGRFERLAYVLRKVRLVELATGDIDRDSEGGKLGTVVPELGLGAGIGEDPRADVDDQAGLLGDIDEVARRHQAAVVLPANQGLRADVTVGREAEDRLVEGDELVAIDGVTQCGLGREPLLRSRVDACIEHFVARAPFSFAR